MGNTPSDSLPDPVLAQSSVKVNCTVTHTLSPSLEQVTILCLAVPCSILIWVIIYIVDKMLDKPQSKTDVERGVLGKSRYLS